MQSSNILCLLVAGASCAGAFLYSSFQRNHSSEADTPLESLNKIIVLEDKVRQLQDEIVTLRELAQQTGDIQLPDAIKKFIENDTGLSFKSLPSVFKDEEEALFKAAKSSWLMHFGEAGMHDRAMAFEKIGLMPPNNLLNQLATLATGPGTARAIYDYENNLILVASNFDINHADDLRWLAMQLTQAIISQNYPADSSLTDDAWLARNAIILSQSLSTAEHLKTRYTKNFGLLGSELNSLVSQEKMNQAMSVYQAMPLYVKFIYSMGTRYAADYLLKNRKESTAKTLQYCLKQATSTSVFFSNEALLTDQYKSPKGALISTTLGPSAIHAHALRGDLEKAAQVTNGYLSDHLTVIKTASGDFETKWLLRFKSEEIAQLFAKHLKGMIDNGVDSCSVVLSGTEVIATITQKPLAE